MDKSKAKTLGAKPAWHIAAHHAAFSASAFCKVQLILRCCGSGVGAAEQMVERNALRSSAWLALHLSGFAPKTQKSADFGSRMKSLGAKDEEI